MNEIVDVRAKWAATQGEASQGREGTLSFDPARGFIVSIPSGFVMNDVVDPIGSAFEGGCRAEALYGYGDRGQYITLFDSLIAYPQARLTDSLRPYETIRARCALVGDEGFVERNPQVSQVRVEVAGLLEWAGADPSNDLRRAYETPAEGGIVWPLILYSSEECRIEVDTRDRSRSVGNDAGASVATVFDFVGRPLPLDSVLEKWVYPLLRMLDFCMGYHADVRFIDLIAADSGDIIRYYAPFIVGVRTPKWVQFRCMPLPYTSLAPSAVEFTGAWYNMPGDEDRCAKVLTGLMRPGVAYALNGALDLRFTVLAGAFEAISRVGHEELEGKAKRDARYMRRKALASIADPDIRNWVEKKLQHAGEVSADEYAAALLDELGGLANLVVPERMRFLTDHRSLRNAYVHRTHDLDGHVLDGADLLAHTKAVETLCYGAVLLHLGYSPEAIVKRFSITGFMRDGIVRASDLYAK